MKKLLLLFLFFVSCNKTIDYKFRGNNSVFLTNIMKDTFEVYHFKTNNQIYISTNKEYSSSNTNLKLEFKTNLTILTQKQNITQLKKIILKAPTKGFVNDPLRVELYVSYNENDKTEYKFDVQNEYTNYFDTNIIFISLDAFDNTTAEIKIRSISENFRIQANENTKKVVYLVKFIRSGTRYLMVLISRGGYGDPIIEQKIKINVTFQTWIEKFWGVLVGGGTALAGLIVLLLKIAQNIKDLKDSKDLKKEDYNITKEDLEELLDDVKEDIMDEIEENKENGKYV